MSIPRTICGLLPRYSEVSRVVHISQPCRVSFSLPLAFYFFYFNKDEDKYYAGMVL
jgi:hypothetical protein